MVWPTLGSRTAKEQNRTFHILGNNQKNDYEAGLVLAVLHQIGFVIHFIMPFLIFVLVIFHLIFLHTSGSNNPIGLNSSRDLISFHQYYTIKNLIGFILALSIFLAVIILVPNVLTDPENFCAG